MIDLFTSIASFVNQWLGTAVPELFLLFLALLLSILVLAAIWDKRVNPTCTLVGAGICLLLFSLSLGESVSAFYAVLDTGIRIRVTAVFISFSMLLFTLYSVFKPKTRHGTSLTAPFIILIGVAAVFFVGSLAPRVMIGDEVTHFYMMKTQAADLTTPNFTAEIPTGSGGVELRNYPHSFLWHYLGAVLFQATDGSFLAIQLYQGLFLSQLLGVAYLLARSRGGVETRAALIYLLLIVSLPMTLIFSVAFYQGVPMTAQVLTAFYLLRKNRWIFASGFLCFALGLKVTAILFFPVFFLYLLIWTYQRCSIAKTLAVTCCSLLLVGSFTFGLSAVIKEYGHATFYPVEALERIGEKLSISIANITTDATVEDKYATSRETSKEKKASERRAEIIANHPGTLHVKVNYLVYGGVLLYLAFGCTLATGAWQLSGRKLGHLPQGSSLWLWVTGLSYIILAAWFLKTAPDARFFLPGLVFCMLPMAERVVCLPKSRWIAILFTTLALMQSGYALSKTYQLRQVGPGLMEGIQYLENNPPTPNRIFMYPEGNYRLFPASHEWYLGYYLREFWRGDNDTRIEMLNKHHLGAIVVKKHLINPVDDNITNLGVYPPWFVNDITRDRRFKKVFENSALIIFSVPEQQR